MEENIILIKQNLEILKGLLSAEKLQMEEIKKVGAVVYNNLPDKEEIPWVITTTYLELKTYPEISENLVKIGGRSYIYQYTKEVEKFAREVEAYI